MQKQDENADATGADNASTPDTTADENRLIAERR